MSGVTHRVAEERSLALHREVARQMRANPEILVHARQRVHSWSQRGSVHRFWVAQWERILRCSTEEVGAAITDPSERGRALRQTSPFAGAIDPRTRWAILREVQKRLEPLACTSKSTT